MTSPAMTSLRDSKCVGLLSSQSSKKSSLYRYMGVLLGAVGVGTVSVHPQVGRPPFAVEVGYVG